MHESNSINNQGPKPFKIQTGTSVADVLKYGDAGQKAAASIFDENGDGVYSDDEAYYFNNSKIVYNGDEIRIYNKETGEQIKKTDVKTEKTEYAKKTAKRQKFEQTLRQYGLGHYLDNIEWVGIDGCEVKTIRGKQVLVLHAKSEGYDLELPIDSKFEPKKIEMGRDRNEYNIHFNNVNGTLKIYGKGDGSGSGTGDEHGFAFGGSSNVTVIGSDGVADYVAIEDNAQVTFKTNDYADSILDRTRAVKDEDGHEYDKNINLKPGTTTVKSANL